jgi:NADH-quinone oxidoreductase subunit C
MLTAVMPDVPRASGPQVDQLAFPSRDRYADMVLEFRRIGFELCSDLCAVDYLSHPGRRLPEGVHPERFEVVVNLLSLSLHRRVRVRVQVPEDDPVVASIYDVYPGVDAMEREAFDMLGIVFSGHPDLTRILMPDGWEGHPLRKDYGVGRVPVQFKDAPGPR